MARPTIRDLAEAAGVSVSTVNRVLGGGGNVRQATMQRVGDGAKIGFYGLGSIQSRVAATRAEYRFGFLLHQPTRPWYRNLAAGARRRRPPASRTATSRSGSNSSRIFPRRYIAAS